VSGAIDASASRRYVPHAMHRRLGGSEAGRHSPKEHALSRSYAAIYSVGHASFLPVEAYQLIEALPDSFELSI
tara:strand:- start:1287 stop:1505 length:219 start_codon:yes stop_codon:yes gene_type:complete